MVTGWSYLVGSSAEPASFISCTSAFPLEVTRSSTCTGLSPQSGWGGVAVTGPCQEPARVFSLSKDFCASDWVAAASDANALAAIRTNRTENAMRDFISVSPYSLFRCGCGNVFGAPGFAFYTNFTIRAAAI